MRPRWTVVIALGITLVTVGCLGDDGTTVEQLDRQGDNGTEDPRPSPRFAPPVNISKDRVGAEPMLDVAPDGTIFVTGTGPGGDGLPEQTVWRSKDDGQTWTDVSPTIPTSTNGGLDNALAVGPDGSVYYFNAVGQTPQMFRSDDGGETWLPLPPPVPPAATHRTWIEPRAGGTVHFAGLEAVPSNNVYYTRSEEKGAVWGPFGFVGPTPTMVSELAVAPGGEDLYMVLEDTGVDEPAGAWTLAASHDGGLTWERRPMWTPETQRTTAFMPLTVDDAGTLYFLWAQETNGTSQLRYAYSTDQGESFSDPTLLGDGQTSRTLAWMDVRAPGELGIVTYVADERAHPEEVEGGWHVEYVFVDEADSGRPETYTTRLTSWPVHEGRLCLGVICSEGGRELLDFAGIAFGPEDRAHTAFASSHWGQPASFPIYAGEQVPFGPTGG